MNLKPAVFSAILLAMPVAVASPGMTGVAHAVELSAGPLPGGATLNSALDVALLGVSVGSGRAGVRVGVAVGRPKAHSLRKSSARAVRIRAF